MATEFGNIMCRPQLRKELDATLSLLPIVATDMTHFAASGPKKMARELKETK
jgi:hypothetical protein